eukprot:tig00001331_g8172.t1
MGRAGVVPARGPFQGTLSPVEEAMDESNSQGNSQDLRASQKMSQGFSQNQLSQATMCTPSENTFACEYAGKGGEFVLFKAGSAPPPNQENMQPGQTGITAQQRAQQLMPPPPPVKDFPRRESPMLRLHPPSPERALHKKRPAHEVSLSPVERPWIPAESYTTLFDQDLDLAGGQQDADASTCCYSTTNSSGGDLCMDEVGDDSFERANPLNESSDAGGISDAAPPSATPRPPKTMPRSNSLDSDNGAMPSITPAPQTEEGLAARQRHPSTVKHDDGGFNLHYRPQYQRLGCSSPERAAGLDGLSPVSDLQKLDMLLKLCCPATSNKNPFSPSEASHHVGARADSRDRHSLPQTPSKQTLSQVELTKLQILQTCLQRKIQVPASLISRYSEDFEEVKEIGGGQFGAVYKCRRRVDGWLYAVKKSRKRIRGDADRNTVMTEVFALAAAGDHPNIVRYFNAWLEGDYLYIQFELCEGGSLAKQLQAGRRFSEADLRVVTRHIAAGLEHIHKKNLVHMDIKPENIYVTADGVYKIGDMGMTCPADQTSNVREGDNRYLARELVQETCKDLRKADVFALGASIYELARGCGLPNNGEEWQNIRNGYLAPLPGFSAEFVDLLKALMHSEPARRPTAGELLRHPWLLGDEERHRAELDRELTASRRELAALREELARARAAAAPPPTPRPTPSGPTRRGPPTALPPPPTPSAPPRRLPSPPSSSISFPRTSFGSGSGGFGSQSAHGGFGSQHAHGAAAPHAHSQPAASPPPAPAPHAPSFPAPSSGAAGSKKPKVAAGGKSLSGSKLPSSQTSIQAFYQRVDRSASAPHGGPPLVSRSLDLGLPGSAPHPSAPTHLPRPATSGGPAPPSGKVRPQLTFRSS